MSTWFLPWEWEGGSALPLPKGFHSFPESPARRGGGACDSVQGMSRAVPTFPEEGAGQDFSPSMAKKGHCL